MIYIVDPLTQGSWSECEESCFGGFQLGCAQQAESDQGLAQRGSSSGAWELKVQGVKPIFTRNPPQLYNETQKRKELIREVEMGPFKHEVDDGLDLRKVGF